MEQTTKTWVIGKIGKKQVLFYTKAMDLLGDRYRNEHQDTYEKDGSLHFTPKDSQERFVCNQYVIIVSSKKPAKELYDVEYGSMEWNAMCATKPEIEPER